MNEVLTYLENNAALHEALGIDAHVKLQVKPLGKGEHNENYVFGEQGSAAQFVLRVNRVPQPFHANQVAYEFGALRALEPSGCTPRPLYCDSSAHALGKGVLVESFCAGSELDFDNLQPDDLATVARLMANVHAVPVGEHCPIHRPKDPLQELFDECVDRFSVYRGSSLEDTRYTRWIERFFAATQEKMDASPDFQGEGHIINTETLPSHFLLPARQAARAADGGDAAGAAGATAVGGANEAAALGAFVDWERPIIGEVAQDLAFFVAPSTTFWDSNYLFPRENIQAFLNEYWRAVDGRFTPGAFEARFDAYLAVSVLRSQTWFCKNAARYAQATTPSSERTGVHTVQRTFDKWDIYTSDDFNEMLLRECF